MTRTVRTVLGDVPATRIGRVDYHEHVFQVSPLLMGDELDDEEAGAVEVTSLRASGFDAMVDATPVGLGRRPAALARVSAETGMTIVATTGLHRDAHYEPGNWLNELTTCELATLLVRDLTCGMPFEDLPGAARVAEHEGTPVRAGLLKAAIDYWNISPREHRVLGAVSEAHAATGAPVMVHLEHGSAAFEVLEVLAGLGVASDAVALAHIDRNPDPLLHADLAASGAYLGYDGFARIRGAPDSALIECLARAVELGAGEHILLGGDVARRTRYVAYGGMPGLAYLGDRVLGRIAAAIGEPALDGILRANPAKWLARF